MIRLQLAYNIRHLSSLPRSGILSQRAAGGCKYEECHPKVLAVTSYGQTRMMSNQLKRPYEPLQKAERLFFKYVAKAIRFAKVVRNSDEYNFAKESVIKMFYWTKNSFEKHILQNPKLNRAVDRFKEKVENASNEDQLRKN